jgi:putative ATP-dependent endonuclease of the OLD family
VYISSLTIRNFRNFQNSKFHFRKGINTLIGENGSGKTNVFYALRLLLDENLPRKIQLSGVDFNRALDDWRGHWIVISIEFDELVNDEDCKILAVHAVGDEDGRGGRYSLFFRPKSETRKRLFDYSEQVDKTMEGLKAILEPLTEEDYEAVLRCSGTGDFCEDAVYRDFVGDFENIVFPDPETIDRQIIGGRLPNQISMPSQITCTFVKALRDVEAELRNPQNSPLLKLLKNEDKKKISVSEQAKILGQIKDLNATIGGLDEIQNLTSGIGSSIRGAVGHTYAPNVDIRSEIPDDMEGLFQSLKLWVGDPDEAGHFGRLDRLSLGGLNMIYLSLRLLEYERVLSKKDRAAHFLFIEEPEAHIHTHIQKSLFKNVPLNKTQVIVSTHSTHISSASKIRSVNILSRRGQFAEVFHPAKNLDDKDAERIERYLDAVRSTLLFAKGVVMVEGDAEQILIPELFLKVFGASLDEMGVSLLNIGSTGFENLASLFHDDRIRRRCAILTDLDDLPATEAVVANAENWKGFLNSKKSGLERQTRLHEFSDENQWVELFFAPNTFEVDFLRAGNQAVIEAALPEIYPTRTDYREASSLAISVADTSVSNLEILRLAKKEGKGWFALLLAKFLTPKTIIPDYILQAFAFAAPRLPLQMQVTIAQFRLESQRGFPSADAMLELFPDILKIVESDVLKDFMSHFAAEFPADPLTKFVSMQS